MTLIKLSFGKPDVANLALAGKLALAGLAITLAVPAVAALPSRTTPNVQESAAEVAAIAAALRAELRSLPATATSDDVEASIMFVLSQHDYVVTDMAGALNQVLRTPTVSEPVRTAIDNVRLALLRRKLRRGTAALESGGTSAFSAPSGGGGGGSSNYPQ